jgi:hypothetical protein
MKKSTFWFSLPKSHTHIGSLSVKNVSKKFSRLGTFTIFFFCKFENEHIWTEKKICGSHISNTREAFKNRNRIFSLYMTWRDPAETQKHCNREGDLLLTGVCWVHDKQWTLSSSYQEMLRGNRPCPGSHKSWPMSSRPCPGSPRSCHRAQRSRPRVTETMPQDT